MKTTKVEPIIKPHRIPKPGEYDNSPTFYKLEHDRKYKSVWYNNTEKHFNDVECPVFPRHRRVKKNDENLSVLIKGKKMRDFVFTAYDDLLITDKTAQIFEEHRLTGYKLREVEVANKKLPFKLWQVIVVGKAKLHPDVGMKEVYRCEHCNYASHVAFNSDVGIKIAENSWDSSGFFDTEEYHFTNLVSEKVKKIIDDRKLTGALLIPGANFSYNDFTYDIFNRNWTAEQWKEFFERP
jgi:hypothetical protein